MGTGDANREGGLEPGTPEQPVRFGDYLLVGLAARGGMAEIYRARRADRPGELFAIKVMRRSLAAEERFVDMFRGEGQLALLLGGPSIVTTHDIGEVDGMPYIAMEYLSGSDLNGLLRACQRQGERVPVPLAIHIAARILDGLDRAHNLRGPDSRPLNLVNRDVSPSNVRLTFAGEVKLLDFGIARALVQFTSEIGVLKGKLSYMSPEQCRGLPLDARSDIFSTGAVLHELLTTEKLFRGDTEFALMEAVSRAEVAPPSRWSRQVSPELDAVVLRSLRRDPSERFHSASDFADRLREILAGYRFEPEELGQFVRRVLRREHAEESALIARIHRPVEPAGASPEAGAVSPESSTSTGTGTGTGSGSARLWERIRRRRNK
jgi:serine/threonine-protein kinase